MILNKDFLTHSFFLLRTVLFTFLSITSFSACAQKAVHPTGSYSNVSDIEIKDMDKNILNYINQYRASISLPALKMIDEASIQAAKHSVEMAAHTTAFGHDGYDERISNIVKKIGFVHASAENVAYGKLTAKEVVDLWLNSPEHKKNIEGNYELTGIGVAKDADGALYYTEIFLKK